MDKSNHQARTTLTVLLSFVESEVVTAYVLLIPTLIGLVCFSFGPVLAGFLISFTRWDLASPPEWVGFANYHAMIALDSLSGTSFLNTVYYVVGTVPIGVLLALVFAVAMNQRIRGIAIYRTLYFLPVISSLVAVSLVWEWLYQPQYGLLNFFLSFVGLPGLKWLSDPSTAMPSIILMSIWRGLGFNMVILLAGLQAIPQELYEAAEIDGAAARLRFLAITVPLLSPTIFFVTVVSIIDSFQVFVQTYIMTSGGPLNATTTVVLYIFQQAFEYFHMGYAAALGYVLFMIILVLTGLQFRLQKAWVHYE